MFLGRSTMKKLFLLGLVALVAACSSTPQETYPYGMTEAEWNQLSIKDKTNKLIYFN